MDGRNCYDIDECDINSWETAHGCHPDAKCVNTIGSYECSCLDGFIGNGMATGGTGVTVTIDGMNNQDGCRDIDECNTLKPCGIYTLCTNSQGFTNKTCPILLEDIFERCYDSFQALVVSNVIVNLDSKVIQLMVVPILTSAKMTHHVVLGSQKNGIFFLRIFELV